MILKMGKEFEEGGVPGFTGAVAGGFLFSVFFLCFLVLFSKVVFFMTLLGFVSFRESLGGHFGCFLTK